MKEHCFNDYLTRTASDIDAALFVNNFQEGDYPIYRPGK